MPIVSILLPVYNAIHDLPRALGSLRQQTFTDFEIIAVDDGSTDGSGELLDQYSHLDPRIRVFHQSNAGALGKVLNKAAELAQGFYLARQDADDASAFSRLANQVHYLQTHPEKGLCGTWAWFIDAELGPMFSYELPDGHERIVRYMESGQNPIVHGSVMLRHDLFEKSGGYRGSYSEDFDLWLRLSEVTQLGICQNLGYYYWRSVGGINTGSRQRQEKLNQVILQLHRERLQHGHELSDWNTEYMSIMRIRLGETKSDERLSAVHYARGLHLLRLARRHEALTEFHIAARGTGPYSQKALRNLRFIWLWPLMVFAYQILAFWEPFRYTRTLPFNSRLPNFLLQK